MDRPRRDPNTPSGDPLLYFLSTERSYVQTKTSKQLFTIVVIFPNGNTRQVKVKAADRETAEHRALKFHPNARRVKRDGAS